LHRDVFAPPPPSPPREEGEGEGEGEEGEADGAEGEDPVEAMLAEATAAAAAADSFAASSSLAAAAPSQPPLPLLHLPISGALDEAAGPRTPNTGRRMSRRRRSSVLPSASKLDKWNTKLGKYRQWNSGRRTARGPSPLIRWLSQSLLLLQH
jgi:hypothetical protein